MAKPVSGKQIAMMYGMAKRCGLDNDTLHDLVKCRTGQDSIRALSSGQANLVIGRMQELLGESAKTPSDRATEAQVRKIYGIAREMGWMDNPMRLRSFLEKRFGCSDVAFLPASKVSAVIEALKAMQDGGRGDRKERAQ